METSNVRWKSLRLQKCAEKQRSITLLAEGRPRFRFLQRVVRCSLHAARQLSHLFVAPVERRLWMAFESLNWIDRRSERDMHRNQSTGLLRPVRWPLSFVSSSGSWPRRLLDALCVNRTQLTAGRVKSYIKKVCWWPHIGTVDWIGE